MGAMTRRTVLGLVLLVAAAACYVAVVVARQGPPPGGDTTPLTEVTSALAAGQLHSAAANDGLPNPPGYPLLISPFVAAFPSLVGSPTWCLTQNRVRRTTTSEPNGQDGAAQEDVRKRRSFQRRAHHLAAELVSGPRSAGRARVAPVGWGCLVAPACRRRGHHRSHRRAVRVPRLPTSGEQRHRPALPSPRHRQPGPGAGRHGPDAPAPLDRGRRTLRPRRPHQAVRHPARPPRPRRRPRGRCPAASRAGRPSWWLPPVCSPSWLRRRGPRSRTSAGSAPAARFRGATVLTLSGVSGTVASAVARDAPVIFAAGGLPVGALAAGAPGSASPRRWWPSGWPASAAGSSSSRSCSRITSSRRASSSFWRTSSPDAPRLPLARLVRRSRPLRGGAAGQSRGGRFRHAGVRTARRRGGAGGPPSPRRWARRRPRRAIR